MTCDRAFGHRVVSASTAAFLSAFFPGKHSCGYVSGNVSSERESGTRYENCDRGKSAAQPGRVGRLCCLALPGRQAQGRVSNSDAEANPDVVTFYRHNHAWQTFDFVWSDQGEYLPLHKGRKSIWEAAEFFNSPVDESDQDTDLTQIGCRQNEHAGNSTLR